MRGLFVELLHRRCHAWILPRRGPDAFARPEHLRNLPKNPLSTLLCISPPLRAHDHANPFRRSAVRAADFVVVADGLAEARVIVGRELGDELFCDFLESL